MKYIKIDKNAIYELLREYFIDEQKNLFEDGKLDDTIQSFYLDENMNFTCLLQNENKDTPYIDLCDLEKITTNLPITTDSLYSNSKKYKNISKTEIQNIIKKF